MTQTTKPKYYGNHYAIVSFNPKLMTDKTLFLFETGHKWTDDEKTKYINWFLSQQKLRVDTIKLDVSLKECQELRHEDKYVDWNNIPYGYFKYLQSDGQLGITPLND